MTHIDTNHQFNLNLQFISLIPQGDTLAIKEILKNGADISCYNNKALFIAYKNKHINVLKLLILKGANIHYDNEALLIEAVKVGDLTTIQFLFEKGADIHINYERPLKVAAKYNQTQVAQYLIDNQADIPKSKILVHNNKHIKPEFLEWLKKVDEANHLKKLLDNELNIKSKPVYQLPKIKI